VKFPKVASAPSSSFALAASENDVTSGSAESGTIVPNTTGQLSEFQQAMVFQAVVADKILPGHTVASQVTSMSSEREAARYLDRLHESIETSRDAKPKTRKTTSKAVKATKAKKTKKATNKKR
jgi:hypothetical protein